MSIEQKDGSKNVSREDIRVYILDNGRLECDANLVVTGTVVGTKEDKTPTIKWIKIPTYAVLIDHPKKKILYDLGTHPDRIYPELLLSLFPYHFEEDQRFENQLALAGFEPEDISTVILSHLHFDHCGNLDLFKHADFYFHSSELAELEANPHISIENKHFIDQDTEILPGLEVITLPGHTAGVLGLIVHLREKGTLIFTADASYCQANYGPPARPSGNVYDTLSYYKSIEKIHGLEKAYGAKIIYGHDMDLFQTLKKAPEYYI